MTVSDYDPYAAEYAAYTAERERDQQDGSNELGHDRFGILPYLLDLLGDLSGQTVLDAGCGDGYLARVLAARGAHITGMDLSPSLIAQARARDPHGAITYHCADLSQPQPEYAAAFDAVASYLVLNDVANYQGFIATLAAVLKPGGQLVLALNNPYSAVIRSHVSDYFASGTITPYRGLWAVGIKVYHYHRTLEQYLDSFFAAGLCLTKLTDLPTRARITTSDDALPEGYCFPRFMVLAFSKR